MITAVSLGSVCQVKHQIDRFAGSVIASPFDWLVTPFAGLLEILKARGQGLSESVSAINDTARCDRFGVLLPHDFHIVNGKAEITSWQITQAKRKYLHKWGRFEAACRSSEEIVFVRFGGIGIPTLIWPYVMECEPITGEDLNNLAGILKYLFPSLRFSIAWVYHPHLIPVRKVDNLSNSIIRIPLSVPNVKHKGIDAWTGSDQQWDYVFETCKITKKESTIDTIIRQTFV